MPNTVQVMGVSRSKVRSPLPALKDRLYTEEMMMVKVLNAVVKCYSGYVP